MPAKKRNPKSSEPFVVGESAAGSAKPAGVKDRADELRRCEVLLGRIMRITEHVSRGLSLDETLDFVYEELEDVLPYDRIGFSLIDASGEFAEERWARSKKPVKLQPGYRGALRGSSLQQILDTGRARIINDLEAYARGKPGSQSAAKLVAEGIRSSLTCPLIVQGRPVGFMFFSSGVPGAYSDAHVEFFRQIAGILAAVVEKSRLYSELAEKNEIIERQNRLMTHDLEMAQQVQRALIPKKAPESPGLQVAFEYHPATQIGGDVLDVIPVDDKRVLLFLGDAVGHGVPAALVMSAAKASLQSAVAANPHPAVVLGSVNRALTSLLSFHFVTAACALVDRATLSAEIALAGHSPPVWFHADTAKITQKGEGDLPLGVSRDTAYQAIRVQLAPGDALVFTTDGISESMDPEDDQYGNARLQDCVLASGCESASTLLATILRDVSRHAAGREPSDDQTILVVKAT